MVTFKLADIGEGIAEVELLKWHKGLGDEVEEFEAVCEVQSDKAAVEITSRFSGTIKALHHEIGDIIKVGDRLLDVMTDGSYSEESGSTAEGKAEEMKPKTSETKASDSSGATSSGEKPLASPAVRRIARENNTELSLVKGTGKGGVITKEDIMAYLASTSSPHSKPSTPPSASTAAPIDTARPPPQLSPRANKEDTHVVLKGFGRAMVKAMSETAKLPMMNVAEEVDATHLIEIRNRLKDIVNKTHGMKLTLTPFVVKAMSIALLKTPIMNSKLLDDTKYCMFGSHNISIAIDTPGGLVVPNIKCVDQLNLLEIQQELLRLQSLANNNKLAPADLTGGTISLSNVGVVGGTVVKALLFDGQACIMAVGRTKLEPRFEGSSVVPRQIMDISATVDHRHIDGATVARFMRDVRSTLEHPEEMLLYTA